MYKVASEVLPRQHQDIDSSQEGKAIQRLIKASLIVGRAPRTWQPSRKKCRKYRSFALRRLHTPNEFLKSTLSTTNTTLSWSMLFASYDWTMLLCCYNIVNMNFTRFLFFWLLVATNTFAQITEAPSCPVQADPWHSQIGLLVQKRDVSWCDSNSKCMSTASSISIWY